MVRNLLFVRNIYYAVLANSFNVERSYVLIAYKTIIYLNNGL